MNLWILLDLRSSILYNDYEEWVNTFIAETGGRYGNQAPHLFESVDPEGKEWADQVRDGCMPVRKVKPSVQSVP